LAHEFLSGGTVLLKIFLIGILLGIAAAAGALYSLPVVDQHREVSLVTVAPMVAIRSRSTSTFQWTG